MKLPVRTHLLLVVFAPLLGVSLLLTAFFLYSHFQNLQNLLFERAHTTARNLSYSSQSLVQGFRTDPHTTSQLDLLLQLARNGEPELLGLLILDAQGNLLAQNGDNDSLTELKAFIELQQTEVSSRTTRNGLLLSLPLIPSLNSLRPGLDSTSRTQAFIGIYLSHKDMTIHRYQSIASSILIVLIGLLLGGFILVRLQKQICQPLKELTDAIDAFKANKLDIKLELSQATPEFEHLTQGFNWLTQQLANAREDLQNDIDQTTADLRNHLAQLESQNIDLNQARKEAQEASRVKSEFLANMSHEIRTPLNGIIGFTELLLKGPLTAHQKDYLDTIHKSGFSLMSIINDILDFTKIEADKLELEQINFNLRESVAEVMTMLAPMAQRKHLELACLIYEDVPCQIVADPLRIRQVLTNLINNAIKFTQKGSVVIRIMLAEDSLDDPLTLMFRITDTGPGLNKAEQQKLFKPFGQVDSSISRKEGGTGLGLVISKKLVQKMDGHIDVESESGKGSTFWFSLPVKALNNLESQLSIPGKSVLVFEPQNASRLALCHQLRHWQMQPIEIASVQQMELWLKKPVLVDLVILCCHHQQTELDYLACLLGELKRINAPIMAMTNSNEQQDHDELQQLGVGAVLAKPLSPRRLQEALLKLLPQQSIIQQQAPAPQTEQNLPSQQACILAVDDNEANLKLVRILLEEMGVLVMTAVDGLEAVDFSRQQKFDLILMDLQMPHLDGVAATQQIRQQSLNQKTPIVALTAHALREEQRRLLAQGFDDYQTKPISEDQLQNVLKRWLPPELVYGSLPQASDPQALEPAAPLSAIDWPLSLKKAANKTQLAEDMLSMLLGSIPTARQEINQSYQHGLWRVCQQEVHRLHGFTCYCGVPALKDAANRLETALKQEQLALLPDLIDQLNSAMTELEQAAHALRAEG